MTKPKAINRKKLVAFVLSIIAKGVDPMSNEKLEKLKREQYVAEKKLTAAKHKEKRLESEIKRLTRSERTTPPLYSCRNVGNLFERADHSDR